MTTESDKTALNSPLTSNKYDLNIQNDPLPFQNNIFNSKLFIDLDSNFSQSRENSFSSECETNIDLDDDINNKGRFLNKELIEELDSPEILDKKNEENHRLFLALVNVGYEFTPKKYISQQKKVLKQQNKFKNNFGQKKGKNNIKERKGDWVCQFCHNVNFAFRTICNRCKGKKEECLQKIIM